MSARTSSSTICLQHDVVVKGDQDNPEVYALRGQYNRLNKWNTTHGAMHLTHPANNLFAEIVLLRKPQCSAGTR